MGLLKPAGLKQAFLKAAIYGPPGSGKTWTAALIAIGMQKLTGSKKPVAFIDTEHGSDFVNESLFKPAKVQLLTLKSTSFADLKQVMIEASKDCSFLIVDSLTAIWKQIQIDYKAAHKSKFIQFQDWGPIKEEWFQFTIDYLNAQTHVILNGRAGDIYEQDVDEEGRKEINKVGTRMQAEKNVAYEPPFLLEMERVIDDPEHGHWHNRVWVLKDKFGPPLHGTAHDNPTFETFLPHIERLKIGGKQDVIEKNKTNTQEMFAPGSDHNRREWAKRHDILLESIKDEVELRWPNRSDEEKRMRILWLRKLFGTSSRTAIESMPNDKLELVLEKIKAVKVDTKIKEEK